MKTFKIIQLNPEEYGYDVYWLVERVDGVWKSCEFHHFTKDNAVSCFNNMKHSDDIDHDRYGVNAVFEAKTNRPAGEGNHVRAN